MLSYNGTGFKDVA